tara:strand:- start:586 stop:1194 length:609 start_codon:yes stop_codon:yes gene_type:complete
MPNYSKSPNKFLGSIGRAVAGASGSGGGGQVDFSALAGRGGMLGKLAQAAQRRQNRAAGNVPSVVATAGASGMSGRIEGIESRLSALEGGDTTVGATQPAAVAPVETQAQAAASQAMGADQTGNAVSGIGGIGIPVPPPATAQADELGALMASPFTMRQRSNMGPLNLNSPLNGNAFSKAVQGAKASGADTFEVGGKTYNVK